ncbi:MAG: hypothetical protein UY95_C0006G0007 [Parcubacteria group bacterium GW2011_GWA2_56_7]|nr:MAG: hypothetical protein UY95_C0006G0007 [Parcubacteria group bacterium GW2011_GWA2_56_7]
MTPPIEISYKGKWYLYFSDLLADVGEDHVWEAMSDEEIRGAWIDVTDEQDSDLETREKLAHQDLRKWYPDLREQLAQDVSEDDFVTAIAPDALGVFDAFGRLKSVSTDGGKTAHASSSEP